MNIILGPEAKHDDIFQKVVNGAVEIISYYGPNFPQVIVAVMPDGELHFTTAEWDSVFRRDEILEKLRADLEKMKIQRIFFIANAWVVTVPVIENLEKVFEADAMVNNGDLKNDPERKSCCSVYDIRRGEGVVFAVTGLIEETSSGSRVESFSASRYITIEDKVAELLGPFKVLTH